MNRLESADVDLIYSKLCDLIRVHLDHKEIQGFWREEVVQDVASYLIVEVQIHELPRKSEYFWWTYTYSVITTTLQRVLYTQEDLKQHLVQLTLDPEYPFTLDKSPRDYIKIKTRHLESLFRQGKIFQYIDLAKKVFPIEGKSLEYSALDYLKHGKTKVLLQAYGTLYQQRKREFKSCQKHLERDFHRQPPSKRQNYSSI